MSEMEWERTNVVQTLMKQTIFLIFEKFMTQHPSFIELLLIICLESNIFFNLYCEKASFS